jgi:hypothetical protein
MICVVCRGKRNVQPVPLPLTGQIVALCARCRAPRFIAHMRSLLPHG